MNRFLREEVTTPALLIVAILGLFVLTPLADMGLLHSRIPEYGYWLFLTLGVAVITHHPVVRWMGILFALGAVSAAQVPGLNASLTSSGFTLAYLFLLLGVLWQRVFAHGRVTATRLTGAVTIYLLMGVLWGEVFAVIEKLHPGAFHMGQDFGGMPLDSALMYFSYITLTTVGYGDATPALPIAHAMAVLEALIGQLYLAILIGRLVSGMQSPGVEDPE